MTDGDRCVVFRRSARFMPLSVESAWRDWFRVHGITPSDIALHFPIVCHDADCRISWTGHGGQRRSVQGETPALPFPPLDSVDGFIGREISEQTRGDRR